MENINVENLDKIEKFVNDYLREVKEKYYEEGPVVRDKIDHITRVTEIAKKKAEESILGIKKNILRNEEVFSMFEEMRKEGELSQESLERLTAKAKKTKEWLELELRRKEVEVRMTVLAAKMHDIGRFTQYELLGQFDDGKVLHHYLGEDFIARAIYQGKLEPSEELDALRTVAKYHGREKFFPFKENIPDGAKELVDIVGRVDGIENGCIGAVGYLVREAKTDAKSYKKNNPELDMKSVSPEVLEFFKKGEKFDKMKYCKTYADYTLFAAVLAIQALKGKDREIALDAMKNYKCIRTVKDKDGKEEVIEYENAIKGYEDIFGELINPKDKEIAIKVLKGFYENKDYVYSEEEPEDHDGRG